VFSDLFVSWRAHQAILPEKLKATRNTSRVILPANHKWFPTVFQRLLRELDLKIDNFNKRGSGFILDSVTEFTLVITQLKPLYGSIYIPTPPPIAKKQAVINIKNSDQFCFQWAILSCLYPAKNHPTAFTLTLNIETLNFNRLTFPVNVRDIPKFEKQNPQISVNVISLDSENKAYCVEYLSPERYRDHHVNCFSYTTLTRDTTCGSKTFPVSSPAELKTLLVEPVLSATAVSTYFHHSESWIPTFQMPSSFPTTTSLSRSTDPRRVQIKISRPR